MSVVLQKPTICKTSRNLSCQIEVKISSGRFRGFIVEPAITYHPIFGLVSGLLESASAVFLQE